MTGYYLLKGFPAGKELFIFYDTGGDKNGKNQI
jgi:hypothetical protein